MVRFPLGPSTGQVSHRRPNKAGGPTINRGKGNNNAATPWEFIFPVEAKFGKLDWDLAASALNTKTDKFLTESINALVQSWHELGPGTPLLWLNPPYFNITPWVRKCAAEVQLGARVLLLVPASVGANWYWDWVVPYADVYSVGRMVFDDCYDKHGELITTPYPKDLILCHYDWSPDRCLRTGAMNTAEAGSLYRWGWQDGG